MMPATPEEVRERYPQLQPNLISAYRMYYESFLATKKSAERFENDGGQGYREEAGGHLCGLLLTATTRRSRRHYFLTPSHVLLSLA
jgi:hypothetical protein